MNKEFFESLMIKYRDLVEETGCAIINIGPSETCPPYAYSIGFAQFGMPDIIITGNLPGGMATKLINDILAKWRKGGVKLGVDDKVIPGLSVNFVQVNSNAALYNDYANHTIEFYSRHPEFDANDSDLPSYVQMIWPDENGVMPGQDGYNDGYGQTLLSDLGKVVH